MIQKRRELNLDVVTAPSLFKIIYIQKMVFEQNRLEKNYDVMRSSLQNILDNIENKAIKENKIEYLKKIRVALDWYDNILFNKKYLRMSPNGEKTFILPNNIELKVKKAMSFAYKMLNKIIDELNIQ